MQALLKLSKLQTKKNAAFSLSNTIFVCIKTLHFLQACLPISTCIWDFKKIPTMWYQKM